MKYKSSLMALLLVASSTVVLVSGATQAQSTATGVANGFKVSPVRADVTIEKGKTNVQKIYVTNVNNYTITARAVINDFEASTDESGKPSIILDENKSASSNSFKSLVKSIPDITLDAGKTAEVPVTITVPSDAPAGGYYGAVRFVSAETENTSQKNVALSASVGTIFLVKVPGALTEQLQMVEFTAAKNGSNGRFFTSGKDLQVVTRLKNTGNIHVQPFGRVQISDRSGKIVEDYEFNNTDPRANILPNSTRKFTDNLKKQNFIGKYTLTTNLGYGTSGSLISQKTTFWVVPVWVIAVVVSIFVLVIVGSFLLYRKLATKSTHKVKSRR